MSSAQHEFSTISGNWTAVEVINMPCDISHTKLFSYTLHTIVLDVQLLEKVEGCLQVRRSFP